MDKDRIEDILRSVSKGELELPAALDQLRNLPYQDLGFAKIDLHRSLRQGMSEVIFCSGKTPKQVAQLLKQLGQHHKVVLGSRADKEMAAAVLKDVPQAVYYELANMLVLGNLPAPDESLPKVAIVTAGTADLPAAEEAGVVLQAEGVPIVRLVDVGVAGIHRLLNNLEILQDASAVIVVAGMDGALPSVVAGLLAVPVIAVPTSVGYGASFQGLAALLSMLNSCAAGLTVVNIDNGFGAATAALRVVRSLVSRNVVNSPLVD